MIDTQSLQDLSTLFDQKLGPIKQQPGPGRFETSLPSLATKEESCQAMYTENQSKFAEINRSIASLETKVNGMSAPAAVDVSQLKSQLLPELKSDLKLTLSKSAPNTPRRVNPLSMYEKNQADIDVASKRLEFHFKGLKIDEATAETVLHETIRQQSSTAELPKLSKPPFEVRGQGGMRIHVEFSSKESRDTVRSLFGKWVDSKWMHTLPQIEVWCPSPQYVVNQSKALFDFRAKYCLQNGIQKSEVKVDTKAHTVYKIQDGKRKLLGYMSLQTWQLMPPEDTA